MSIRFTGEDWAVKDDRPVVFPRGAEERPAAFIAAYAAPVMVWRWRDEADPEVIPPPGCRDRLMWRLARERYMEHAPRPSSGRCQTCGRSSPCAERVYAQRGLAAARGDIWCGQWASTVHVEREYALLKALKTNPRWWTSDARVVGMPMREVLARRDVHRIFVFLDWNGWKTAMLSEATRLPPHVVSAVRASRRQIEKYDELEQVAVGLRIPRGLMGLAYRKGRATR